MTQGIPGYPQAPSPGYAGPPSPAAPATPVAPAYPQAPQQPAYQPQPQQMQQPMPQPMQPAYPQQMQQPMQPAYPQQPMQPAYPQQMQQPMQPAYPQQPMQPAYPQHPQQMQQPVQPAYPQQMQQQPSYGGDMGASIAEATGNNGAPKPGVGTYRLQLLHSLKKVSPPGKPRRETFIATFRVIESNNPANPPGCEIAYVEGTEWDSQKERIRMMIVNTAGFPAQLALEQAYAAAGQDPAVALKGLCASALAVEGNPLIGRHVCAVVTEQAKVLQPPSPNAGQTKIYQNWAWSPAA